MSSLSSRLDAARAEQADLRRLLTEAYRAVTKLTARVDELAFREAELTTEITSIAAAVRAEEAQSVSCQDTEPSDPQESP